MASRPEHAVDELVELKIGLHLGFIEVVLRLTNLLSIEAIVPRRDGDLGRLARLCLGIGDLLHVRDLFMHAGHSGGPDAHHQVHRLRGVLGHGVGHAIVGVGLKAEQNRALLAQL